jgi:signal transduction histidine kinase/phage shock protein PspC (stress-responsive transcriptional regulator)
MPVWPRRCDDGVVAGTVAPNTPAPRRSWRAAVHPDRVPRSPDRILVGVAGGYAAQWRVEPTVVRAAIGLLTLAGGIGAVLYGIGILTTSPPDPNATIAPVPVDRRRELAIGAITLAVLVIARDAGLWPGDGVMIPAALVAIAVAVMWTPGRPERASGVAKLALQPAIRVATGLVLAIAGIAAMADRTGGLADVGRSASAVAIAVTGAAVIAAPAIGRLVGRLDQERRFRVREEERAALAAHLHDSVLQSLVLIQRSDDPRQMTSLARRQERELRSWLYGGRTGEEPTTLQGAVEAMTAAIEVDHAVRVDAVTVGDQPLDEAATAMLGVLREATTNAARHAEVEHIDVYVEVDDRSLVGYVRDTGVGFDPDAVAADRRGITESIVGRAERAGGKATVTSAPGGGTEVEIRLPRVKP